MSAPESQAALAVQTTAVLPQSALEMALPSEQVMHFCEMIAKSNLVPTDFRGRPADVLIAVMMGSEVGLKPMQALHSVAVINGRPSLWGDGALAVVRAHSEFQDIDETIAGEGDKRTATCTIKRRGQTPVTRTFSVADAKRAGLWSKKGPWENYGDRMLQMRARGFTLRDSFADALKGLAIAEEAMDIPVETPPATDVPKPATRTEGVTARLAAQAATIDPQPAPEEPPIEAQTRAIEEPPKPSRDELLTVIGNAWKPIGRTAYKNVIEREFGKGRTQDLTDEQLADLLERTPELIAELEAEVIAL